jgi:hypothetical protein
MTPKTYHWFAYDRLTGEQMCSCECVGLGAAKAYRKSQAVQYPKYALSRRFCGALRNHHAAKTI